MGVPYLKRQDSLRIVSAAFARAAEVAAELGVTILLEAVNTRVDHPGVLFSRTEDSYGVARQVNSPRVKVLYDLYHSVAEGEDTQAVLRQIAGAIGHVQVADFPGRGEPGSGRIDWNEKLAQLRDSGYAGVIGVECHPTQSSTADALQVLRRSVQNVMRACAPWTHRRPTTATEDSPSEVVIVRPLLRSRCVSDLR